MATLHATVNQSPDDAALELRKVAAGQGYSFFEGHSVSDTLVFNKGVGAFSWGSSLTVTLKSSSPSITSLAVTTTEVFAVTDWGRGKRSAKKLLEGIGAIAR